MKSINLPLLFGGVFGFVAVALGALADHVLRPQLSPDDYQSIATALRYQLIHAVMLAVLGLTRYATVPAKTARLFAIAAAFFVAGIFLFCGGIYTGIIFDLRPALHLVPIGGTSFMLGWLVLALSAFI